MQWHFYGDRLLLIDAQEIGVQDEGLGRMALKRFDYGFFFILANVQCDDMGEKGFVLGSVQDVVMGNGQRHGVLVAAIENGRYRVIQTTQAAARTFP